MEGIKIMDTGNTQKKPLIERDEVLGMLAELIEISKEKGVKGRIKTPTNERIRIDWIKTAIHGISAYLNGLKDIQLDEIDKRLETLEAGNEHEGTQR